MQWYREGPSGAFPSLTEYLTGTKLIMAPGTQVQTALADSVSNIAFTQIQARDYMIASCWDGSVRLWEVQRGAGISLNSSELGAKTAEAPVLDCTWAAVRESHRKDRMFHEVLVGFVSPKSFASNRSFAR